MRRVDHNHKRISSKPSYTESIPYHPVPISIRHPNHRHRNRIVRSRKPFSLCCLEINIIAVKDVDETTLYMLISLVAPPQQIPPIHTLEQQKVLPPLQD